MQNLDADPFTDEEAAAAGTESPSRRITALVATAIALVLLPALAYVAFGRDTDPFGHNLIVGQSGPDGGSGVAAPGVAGPGADAPTNAPSGAKAGVAQQPWQAVDLAAATLTLGAWRPGPAGSPPCPTGSVTFAGSAAAVPGKAVVRLLQNARVDVDHDGTDDIAVLVSCQDSQAGTFQAVVLKTGANGHLTTMGQIAHAGPGAEDIVAVGAGSGGLVNLTVGDVIPCCGVPRSLQLTQVRTFAWQHNGFAQVAGPITFVANRSSVNLDVSAPAVHLGGLVAGRSTGTLTVTVTNRGPRDAMQVSVAVSPDQPLAPATGGDWARCLTRDGTNRVMVCPLGNLAVGKAATLTLPLTGLFGNQAITVQPRIGDQAYGDVRVPSYYS